MKGRVLDGKACAAKVRETLALEVKTLKVVPHLTIVQVGDRSDSTVYVRQKERAGEEIGVKVTKLLLPAAETTDGLLQHIRRLNEDPTVHGIIVQMPVPDHMNSSAILEAIDYTKDVDGFHVRNAGELAQRNGKPRFVPCTAVGVMTLLEHNGIDVRGKRAAVIGRSDIVGMPVFQLLTKAGATVTLCHTQTTNLIECTREADVLVVAAGKPEMIRKEHVKPGSVVVDVGIHTIPGTKKLCGDVKFDEVVEVASAVSPVPGGVGPLTVAMLLQNTVRAAKAAEEARQKRMQYIPLQLERPVPSDDEISRKVTPKPIMQVGRESGFLSSELYQYGEYKAKIRLSVLDRLRDAPLGKMVVVTGINPTKFGEGKTTTLLGLVQALNVQLGKLAFGTIRQPSQGPTFGTKGGAAGGGYSQVIPMADVNLHLTGDIHAVTAATNLLAAAIDTRILHEKTQKTPALFRRLVPEESWTTAQVARLRKVGIAAEKKPKDLTPEEMERFARLSIDPSTIFIRRVVDVNDRLLRVITIGQGEAEKGFERKTGYDISVASELMAVLALASSQKDLSERLARIVVAKSTAGEPVTVEDLCIGGALEGLLNEAIMPNLIQTLEGTPVLMHAGPFANIAHGQSSILADAIALRLAGPEGFCVTEAGFGADMGFEKYVAIKSRASGIGADCAVLVVTVRAIKMHGEGIAETNKQDPATVNLVELGCANVRRHIRNTVRYGAQVVVAINARPEDTPEDYEIISRAAREEGAFAAVPTHGWASGSGGAADLARAVVEATAGRESKPLQHLYALDDTVEQKIRAVATKIYGASDVSFTQTARDEIAWIERHNLHRVPICMSKTPLSFSHDPEIRGAPEGFVLPVTSVRFSNGAGFVVALCGDVQTMPGLPTRPAYFDVHVENGQVQGLF